MSIIKRKAEKGYGIALIIVFGMALIISLLSVQMLMVPAQRQLLVADQNNSISRNAALASFRLIQNDIVAKLNASQTVNTSYSYAGTVSAPQSPNALAGTTDIVGSFVATILKIRGTFYLVQVDATVNGGTSRLTRMIQVDPPFNCQAVEDAILKHDNLDGVIDADLIKYAQHDCMVKTLPSLITTLPVTPDTTHSDCSTGMTYAGATRNVNSGCTLSISGSTYPTVYLGSISKEVRLLAGVGATVLHANSLNTRNGYLNGDNATNPLVFRLNAVVGETGNDDDTFHPKIIGGSKGDITSIVNDLLSGHVDLGTGKDTLIVGGSIASDLVNTVDETNILMGSDDDIIYTRNTSGNSQIHLGPDNDQIYFQNHSFGNIFGEAGDDVIACTNVFGEGCTGVTNNGYIYGGDGNDIISIDGDVDIPASTTSSGEIYGDNGNNIIYAKSTHGGSASRIVQLKATSSTSGGGSLIIIGGNRVNTSITSSGSKNVLLIKSGSTATNSATPTPGGSFKRVLYY